MKLNNIFRQPLDMNGIYTIPIPFGNLLIFANDPCYPGVNVDLDLPDGTCVSLATVEIDPENDGRITTYVYDDANQDEYSHKVIHKNIPCFCKSCGKELQDDVRQVNSHNPVMHLLCLDCLKRDVKSGDVQMCFKCAGFFIKEIIDSHCCSSATKDVD